jgi:hypothetical protein
LQLIEAAQEKQIGNLFNDFERIGDATAPERILDGVDLIADFTGEHA